MDLCEFPMVLSLGDAARSGGGRSWYGIRGQSDQRKALFGGCVGKKPPSFFVWNTESGHVAQNRELQPNTGIGAVVIEAGRRADKLLVDLLDVAYRRVGPRNQIG